MPSRETIAVWQTLSVFTFGTHDSLVLWRFVFPEPEGTAFCEILSNSYNSWQYRLHGDILLNGVSVSPARLQDRVAYVRRNNAFGADMSVRQTMLFHSFLREPGAHARSRDAKGRVSHPNTSFYIT